MSAAGPDDRPGPPASSRLEVEPGVGLVVDRWVPGGEGAGGGGRDEAPAAFVVLHGLASNARLWWATAAHLAGLGHAVAAVDQRGHGRSDKPDHGYTLEGACQDAMAVVEHLRATEPGFGEAVVVAGQSWGANVALELGYRHPGAFSGVVCVDGGTIELSSRFESWDACVAALEPPRLAGMPRAAFEATVRAAHPDWPESGIQATLANLEVRGDGTVAPWLERRHHMELLRALWEHRPSTRYAGMRTPVLFVPADDGRSDLVRDKAAAVDLAVGAIPRARAHWFRPADHDLHAQHPVELAEVMHAEAEAWEQDRTPSAEAGRSPG